jgi:hypothetical protein
MKYNFNGNPHETDYEDLGLVIDAVNVAAGAFVYSSTFVNVQWVRNIVALSQSDQQYDIYSYLSDSSGIVSSSVLISSTALGSVPNTWWRNNVYNSTNGVLGYGVKFGIKNSSASPNTFA